MPEMSTSKVGMVDGFPVGVVHSPSTSQLTYLKDCGKCDVARCESSLPLLAPHLQISPGGAMCKMHGVSKTF